MIIPRYVLGTTAIITTPNPKLIIIGKKSKEECVCVQAVALCLHPLLCGQYAAGESGFLALQGAPPPPPPPPPILLLPASASWLFSFPLGTLPVVTIF
jgi:hypothetical protein